MTMAGGKCAVCKVVAVVAGLGAVNWGLVGVLQVDLVAQVFGEMSGAARAVYTLIGVAGILTFLGLLNLCPCSKAGCEPKK
jgi:hypothetical protein